MDRACGEVSMNKLQIKAEVLTTLRAFMGSTIPDPSLLTDLKKILKLVDIRYKIS